MKCPAHVDETTIFNTCTAMPKERALNGPAKPFAKTVEQAQQQSTLEWNLHYAVNAM